MIIILLRIFKAIKYSVLEIFSFYCKKKKISFQNEENVKSILSDDGKRNRERKREKILFPNFLIQVKKTRGVNEKITSIYM